MRHKTAAIWSAVLVAVTAGMFALPAAVWTVFLPSLKQGLPDPIPGYERVLLEIAVFCGSVKWMLAILALPITGALFTVAEFMSNRQAPQGENRNASAEQSATRPLESERGGGLEPPVFTSIRSFPARSKCGRDGPS